MIFIAFLILIVGASFAFIYWQVQKSILENSHPEVLSYHAEEHRYFVDIHSPTVGELAEALRGNGFVEAAAAAEGARQSCFRLVATADDDASPGTRVGGAPDLPDLALWPRWEGVPLAFLAQIDLAEVAALNPDAPLPKTGLLSFFYDAEQRAWGFNPEDRASWRVLYFPDAFEPMPMNEWPEGLPAEGIYPLVPVFTEAGESLPDEFIDSFLTDLSPREGAMLEDIMDQYQQCYEGAAHQVLGFPYTIQGDMRLECQLVSSGINCGNPSGYKDPRAKDLEPGAADWRLLFQLDSDDRAGMMWGDMGTLYFWIKEQDLAAGRFDQVWMVLQCA